MLQEKNLKATIVAISAEFIAVAGAADGEQLMPCRVDAENFAKTQEIKFLT